MKWIEAIQIPDHITAGGLEKVAVYMESLQSHDIDNLLWLKVTHKPGVRFSIAYDDGNIFLKYRVDEKFIKTVHLQTNSPVYRDSCVEFFIAFNDDEHYYNLEFNSAGTALAGYGKDRNGRELLPVPVVNGIRSYINAARAVEGKDLKHWELSLQIPFKLFIHHQITNLAGTTSRVNFYKCGDDLPEPHYLSWNYIPVAEPDFHLSEYFGALKFV